ncbi:hypothetical protein F5J12DRAFT_766662, partial [Pisolithus orientalis]|uniref:uncharacterized protein n=1 Tax=Pisolithus orientalis TaxID=936130 RepID=UPI0022247919
NASTHGSPASLTFLLFHLPTFLYPSPVSELSYFTLLSRNTHGHSYTSIASFF